jgi:hypothetical protein
VEQGSEVHQPLMNAHAASVGHRLFVPVTVAKKHIVGIIVEGSKFKSSELRCCITSSVALCQM